MRQHLNHNAFGLIEVLVAALILALVMIALASAYFRGFRLIDHEEDRRKATAAAQFRIEQARSFPFDDIPVLFNDQDTTLAIDGVDYTVGTQVGPGPNDFIHELQATVRWEVNQAGDVQTLTVTTYVGKVLQPQPVPTP